MTTTSLSNVQSEASLAQVVEPTFAGLRLMANRRRIALTDVGCATYILGSKPGQDNILCVCCGMLSYNPNDIKNKFCAFCNEYHAEWK